MNVTHPITRRPLLISVIAILLAFSYGHVSEAIASEDQLADVIAQPTLRVVVTDSGLGGMSVAADVYERLLAHRGFREADVIFFNCQPHETSGYNRLPNTAEKAWVFDNALEVMVERFEPDVILIACNTLSVIYDETKFSQTTEIPVVGIVEPGVRLIESHLANDTTSQVAILGTPTTIERGQHRSNLLSDGISDNRIIVQACSRLAGRIERDPNGTETLALVDQYTSEVVAQLDQSKKPLFVSYNCTHYGYVNGLFKEAFAKHGIDVSGFLDPNSLLADPLFPESTKHRFEECDTRVSVYSQPALSDAKLTAIYDLIAPTSTAAAKATKSYQHTPNSFKWQR